MGNLVNKTCPIMDEVNSVQLSLKRLSAHLVESLLIHCQPVKPADDVGGITAVFGSFVQYRLLRELGCRFGQGYLFSPAVPPEDFARFLA